jgi:hypothetical protein
VVANFPQLNITSSFLGKEGIRLSLDGESTIYIPTMTGAVTSPEPYQMASVTAHLLKTQNLASVYKGQVESASLIGDLTVVPDASTLPSYPIINCSIASVQELNFSGDDAGWVVMLRGYYLINSSLFAST